MESRSAIAKTYYMNAKCIAPRELIDDDEAQTLLYKAILMREHKSDLAENFTYKRFRHRAIAKS